MRYALQKGARLIIGSHRGRPKNKQDKKSLSLEPLGAYLSQHLNCELIFIKDLRSTPSVLFSSLNEKRAILLENLRFHSEEETGDEKWASALARHVDIYINEAFSVSHRNHASMTCLPQKVKERGMGFYLQKEIKTLDLLRENPPSPFVLLIGGVKVSDKIKTLIHLSDRVDVFLIGGLMAYTFLKAKGVETGEAFVEKDCLKAVMDFMERLKMKNKTLLLPLDHVGTQKNLKTSANTPIEVKVTKGPALPKGFVPLDIGSQTIDSFSSALKSAGTVLWNGPMGKFEDPRFAKGTLSMCEAMACSPGTLKVIGGGDSLSAFSLMKKSLKENQDQPFKNVHISTGGGACLKYLEQGQLAGLKSLLMRKPSTKETE